MRWFIVFCCALLLNGCNFAKGETDADGDADVDADTDAEADEKKVAGEKKVSEQLRAIIEHYKLEDPVGLPGAPIQDPMPIPEMKHSFSVAKMHFKDANVYGLTKFRIEHVRSDLAAMQVSVGLRIEKLEILGNYTMSTWFSRSSGRFNVTLIDVYIVGVARLEVDRSGRLQAQDINMDITFSNIMMDFENLGFMGTLFQSIINSVGTFLFDNIKPIILRQVNNELRGTLNEHISKIPQRFPNSIPPLDMAIAEGRKYIRDQGYDPYLLPNHNYSAGFLKVDLTNTWATGLSTFYRVGNVTVTMEENIVHVGLHVGTQRLRGQCIWEVGVGGLLSRAGTASFTAEYLHVSVNIQQALDTRNKPVLEGLDIKLGNIQARVNGAGTLDYAIELLVNILPNLLRYQIMDAVEGPIKRHIQAALDTIDIEAILDEKLPEIDAAVNNLN